MHRARNLCIVLGRFTAPDRTTPSLAGRVGMCLSGYPDIFGQHIPRTLARPICRPPTVGDRTDQIPEVPITAVLTRGTAGRAATARTSACPSIGHRFGTEWVVGNGAGQKISVGWRREPKNPSGFAMQNARPNESYPRDSGGRRIGGLCEGARPSCTSQDPMDPPPAVRVHLRRRERRSFPLREIHLSVDTTD